MATFTNPVTPPADLVTQGILDNISNVALNYANQIYSWGQGVFNNVMNVTNQNLASLTQAADTAMGGANSSMNAFNNSFMPDYQTLRTEAANYANPARQASNAGGAESGQMQGNQAAMENAKQSLQSYGIDPSSGRYADLEMAGRTAGAAAAVGAGQQSVRADTATGLGLQKQALDYGIQMPGIAANFLNQANQANSIKQNAITSAANTGANLMSLPNAYLNTAKVGYPPSGQQSTQGGGGGGKWPADGSGGRGGGGGGPGNGGGGPGGGQGSYNPNWSSSGNQGPVGFTPSQFAAQGSTDINGSPVNGTQFDNYTSGNNYDYGGQMDPLANNYGGYNTGYDQNTGYNANGSDPNASYNDPYSSTYAQDPNSYNATQFGNAPSDWSNYNDTSGWPQDTSSQSSFDPNSYSADTSSQYTDSSSYNMPDTSSWGDSSGYTDPSSYDSTGYAAGGAIPDPTTGGQVPPTASPSLGAQTDDVHAKLNAGEFVIPKDVAAWKGHEFFQKLIAQSRKGRATAGAQGKPTSPPTGPVRFASQPMG